MRLPAHSVGQSPGPVAPAVSKLLAVAFLPGMHSADLLAALHSSNQWAALLRPLAAGSRQALSARSATALRAFLLQAAERQER